MKVEVDGHIYTVDWQHIRGGEKNDFNAITDCFIIDENGHYIGYDHAICSKKDNFDRSIGRKLSLARAISGLKKEQRRKFWEAYFETHNH